MYTVYSITKSVIKYSIKEMHLHGFVLWALLNVGTVLYYLAVGNCINLHSTCLVEYAPIKCFIVWLARIPC